MSNKAILDDKYCFDLWNKLGTLDLVADQLEREGIVNPRTGKPYHLMTVWTAASRWMVENPEKSRKYFTVIAAYLDDESWEEFLVERAMSVYKGSKRNFLKWARKMGLFDKYFDTFADHFGLRR
jgi:hypothetical protein